MSELVIWAVALLAGVGVTFLAYHAFKWLLDLWDAWQAGLDIADYKEKNFEREFTSLYSRVAEIEKRLYLLECYQNELFYGNKKAPNSVEDSTKFMGVPSPGESVKRGKRGPYKPRKSVS